MSRWGRSGRRWLQPGASAAAGGCLSPSTVPAAARPPPLPVAATARPAPPNTHPPARPSSWRRAGPPTATATEARALVTPFSFLCLCPRHRFLARPIAWPRPALCPPPHPRRVASAERRSAHLGFRARCPQGSPLTAAARVAGSPCSMGVGPWPTPLGLPILQPAGSPAPTRSPCEAARRSLPVRTSSPLVSVSTEWRRRRCCEQRDPRAAESSLCKAG